MCMQRTSYLVVWPVLVLFSVVSGGCAREEPGVEIPLNEIWAKGMSSTQNIRTLEPDHFGPTEGLFPGQNQVELLDSSLSNKIHMAIGRQADEKQPIGPGFAVAGTGRQALSAVKDVMEQDQTPQQNFLVGTDVSLFSSLASLDDMCY